MATSGGEEAAAVAPAAGVPAPAGDTTPGWEVAVRPLLSASYSAFEMKELPQLVASVIERYRAAAPAGRVPGGGWEVVPEGAGPQLPDFLLRLRDAAAPASGLRGPASRRLVWHSFRQPGRVPRASVSHPPCPRAKLLRTTSREGAAGRAGSNFAGHVAL